MRRVCRRRLPCAATLDAQESAAGSGSLPVSEPSVAAAQVVEMVGCCCVRLRRGRAGQPDLGHVGRWPELTSVMVKGSPATCPVASTGWDHVIKLWDAAA